MAGAGTKPTAKTYADICLREFSLRPGEYAEVAQALREAKAICAGQTGTAYGRCMDATYPRMVIKRAQGRLQGCGEKIDIKGGCTWQNCAPAIRADIAAYLRGEDPVAARAAIAAAKLKAATTPQETAAAVDEVKKAAEEAAAAAAAASATTTVAAESEIPLPGSDKLSIGPASKVSKWGVPPLYLWLAGGAAAFFLLTRSSK